MNNEVLKEFSSVVLANSRNTFLTPFDFGSCELTVTEIADVSMHERKFLNTFRKYRNNLFEICESLAEIKKVLEPKGQFMAWYESVGLTKDMVSVFGKRWSLYLEFQEFKERVFSFSDQVIKILTNKDLQYEEVKAILEGNIYKAKEVRQLLAPVIEKNQREFLPKEQKFFNFNKVKKMEKRVKSLNENEKIEYKKELEEYIKKLVELKEKL